MNQTDNGCPGSRSNSEERATGTSPGSKDARLTRAVEEYLAALEAGAVPDRREFLDRYPDIAGPLAECLDGLAFVNAAAAELHASAAPEVVDSTSVSAGSIHRGETLGDFRIVREVGRGGMGVVYEAEQLSLSRRVALKVLPFAATLDPRQMQRFKNEAQAAAHLQHQNIVPVHFVGCERGVHFYAMQYIEGRTLAALIAELREPSRQEQTQPERAAETMGLAGYSPAPSPRSAEYFRTVARLGEQAAQALEHAHELGVVHRDIKPGNLLVDVRGNLWITDFGLAHCQHNASLTLTGDLLGTLRYMSPEQALGKRLVVDHRTDVYSLGATLYELLTLRPALTGTDREELLRQIASEEPRPPRRLDKAIPVELETIVLKAMEKAPAHRYATTQELADDLRRFLHDEPIRARRPTLLQRVGKWSRRHRPLVWSAATVLAVASLILAGNVGWTARDWATRRAETERVVAEALDESSVWQERRRLPEALSAARRAAGLVEGGTADDVLRRRVQARVADLELLEKLENVRLEMTAAVIEESVTGDPVTEGTVRGSFDQAGADRLYGEVFRKAGLDVEALSPEAAAERIRELTVAAELAAALDDWAACRRVSRGADDTSWKHLLRVARAADPDDGRNRLRDSQEQGDSKALLDLAESEAASRFLPSSLHILGTLLVKTDAAEQAVAVLTKAQRRYPDDFWLNQELAHALLSLEPPRLEEAIRFYTATVSLRPRSPAARLNLGNTLRQKGEVDRAIAEYRVAIEIKHDYAQAHNILGAVQLVKGNRDEAMTEFRAAIAFKKDFAEAHNNLGYVLKLQGNREGAITEYQEAIRINKNYAEARCNLAVALKEKGDVNAAEAEYRKAIRSGRKYARSHNNLGVILGQRGKLAEAITEFRAAIRINQNYAPAYVNLGHALRLQGKVDEAIDEFHKAIRLNKNNAEAHYNLGIALRSKGNLAGAIDEFREATRINPNYADAHYNLGSALAANGDQDGAITAYRAALQVKEDYAEAHCNLGGLLRAKGLFDKALKHYRRGHELGSKNPRWPYPSARWVREAELLVALDHKLSAVLEGKEKPADTAERLGLAQLCQEHKQFYAAAFRFYREAFDLQKDLTDKPQNNLRYNAACAAALAGCGKGKDAPAGEQERVRLRRQALDWLRADRETWSRLLEKQPNKARPVVAQTMQHWLTDPDFNSVRGPDALAKLPETERRDWQKLWDEVRTLGRRAAKPK